MNFQENLSAIKKRITNACKRVGRTLEEITLIAVTKTQPVEVIREAYDLGLRDFGENRVQELLKKRELLPQDIRWHLIGHLQSNKAKYIVPFINLVHSIDSLETARELSKRALGIGRTLDILIEINVAREASKEGVSVAETELLFHRIVESATSLNVCGLMTVAPFEADPAMVRPYFHELLRIRDKLGIRELSMGMTNDFEIAIEEGATMIRIGSALFGSRVSQNN